MKAYLPTYSLSLWHLGREQCDQIWRFLKVFGDRFSYKSSSNVCWIFGLFWKHPFSSINCCIYLLGNFWKLLGYFIFQHLVTLEERDFRLKRVFKTSSGVKTTRQSFNVKPCSRYLVCSLKTCMNEKSLELLFAKDLWPIWYTFYDRELLF